MRTCTIKDGNKHLCCLFLTQNINRKDHPAIESHISTSITLHILFCFWQAIHWSRGVLQEEAAKFSSTSKPESSQGTWDPTGFAAGVRASGSQKGLTGEALNWRKGQTMRMISLRYLNNNKKKKVPDLVGGVIRFHEGHESSPRDRGYAGVLSDTIIEF